MDIDFRKVLEEKKEIIWKEYQKYLPGSSRPVEPNDKVGNYREEDSLFWKTVSEYPERQGKYIRGSLILLVCEALGFSQEKAALTGAAMQASEDWLLVHDDLEDGSVRRRGGKTLHLLFGENQTINAGDALQIVMWKMLRDNEKVLGAEKTFGVMDEFEKMLMRTSLGQSVEMKWIQENKVDLSDEDLMFVIGGKTVYYSIAGPLRLGGIIAGLDEKRIGLMYELGVPLGRCFQIRDDLLDLTSDFEGQKKQVGNDILEGKRTLMLGHLLRTAKGKDLERVKAIMGKGREEKTEEEVRFIIDSMKSHGSLDYAAARAAELKKQALKAFDEKLGFLDKEPGRSKLKAGIDFILERKK